MRILLLIDSLGSGGAQRQLCLLALGLAKRGYHVSVLTYHTDDFYVPLLEGLVSVMGLPTHRRWRRSWLLRRAIRRHSPDTVIAFLKAPALYAELSAIPDRPFRLIAGERVLDLRNDLYLQARCALHQVATYVVSNSHAQTLMIQESAPSLKAKIRTILNGVDLERFAPGVPHASATVRPDEYSLLSVGRFAPQKDGETLIRGFAGWVRSSGARATLTWFGERGTRSGGVTVHTSESIRMAKLTEELEIDGLVSFHDPVSDIEDVYPRFDAFVLASLYEGCANVIAEAMACGLPVVASRVADNEWLLGGGECGILFNPGSPDGLSRALAELAAMSIDERRRMGRAARARACALFSIDRMVGDYEELIRSAGGG
jgi:glycosyltransferase involved in cell wall biosynthesis